MVNLKILMHERFQNDHVTSLVLRVMDCPDYTDKLHDHEIQLPKSYKLL